MRRTLTGLLASLLLAAAPLLTAGSAAQAQDGPLRIEITDGVIEPLPYAVPDFLAETPAAAELANQITRVIAADLSGTGLFREIPATAHISTVSDFNAPVRFADWKAVNAQALITGSVSANGKQLTVRFRGYDIFADNELGSGLLAAHGP
jgi:TolB protein